MANLSHSAGFIMGSYVRYLYCSSPSQSFVEDQRQKSIRLATIAQPRPLTHATDNLKPADVDSNAFRRHFLKSSQSSSITDPSHIPKDRYQEFSRKQSRKQRRSLRMTDDGESPEPCNGKNLPDHMQAYRRRKLEQNVVKIKEANFVTPCETSQSTANILQPKVNSLLFFRKMNSVFNLKIYYKLKKLVDLLPCYQTFMFIN